MKIINKYQKAVLLLYIAAFIYFSILHVPFKIKRGNELVYDTLFSNKTNIDLGRLFLIIVVTTLVSGVFFLIAQNLTLPFKFRPLLKSKPVLTVILFFILAFSAFLLIQKYRSNFSSNQSANGFDSTSTILKIDTAKQTSLPIFDKTSQTDTPQFLKNEYLYNGKTLDFTDILAAAEQSNLDFNTYIDKAGIIVIDDKGYVIPKTTSKEYKTPNGKIVAESVLRQKYGSRFTELVNNGSLTLYLETRQVKMIFRDGSIGDIDINDTLDAIKAGARRY